MTPADPPPFGGPAEASPRKRRLADLTPLRASPAFARMWIGGTISGIGAQMTIVAVGLQIYAITSSTLAVGLVGGIALLPMVVAGLWGGMIADVFDRRRVLIASSLVSWFATLGLVALSTWDVILQPDARAPLWPFYVVTTLSAVASTVSQTTRSALVGRILPAHLISRATALNGMSFGLMLTVGPAVAGVLVASAGLPWTFAADAVLFTAGFLGIWMLPALPRLGEPVAAGWAVLREGLAFLRRAPNIRMSFIVDIVAMTFARPYVLFPAIGALVVGGGALTVGALTAAGAAGTILASVFSGPVARVHRHGVAIARAITAFGGFALAFGVVILVLGAGHHVAAPGWGGIHWPALVALAITLAGMGAADEVSSIFRNTLLIQAVPDQMRGRLQGVFVVVVAGGPRIGDMYAGVFATAVALWCPPLFGGVAILCLIAVLSRVRFGVRGTGAGGGGSDARAGGVRAIHAANFRDYDARTPTP
jgi:MFS family permease